MNAKRENKEMNAMTNKAARGLRFTASGLLLAVSIATAAGAQTKEEAYCRDTLARNITRFRQTVLKDIASCDQRRSRGELPLSTDCDDAFSVPGSKSAASFAKVKASMLAACPETLTAVRAQYGRCPSPHATLDDEGTSGIDDFDEAAGCLLNLAATLTGGAASAVSGTPETTLDEGEIRCQATLSSSLAKLTGTIAKVRRKCQKAADAAGLGIAYSCDSFDDGKIAAVRTKLASQIVRNCSLSKPRLAAIGTCAHDPVGLVECANLEIGTRLGGGLIAAAYELPSTCKLGHVALTLHAGHGDMLTHTHYELGWTGHGHEDDLLDNFEGAIDLACNDDCDQCAVTMDPVKEKPNGFCRCDGDPTVRCDTISGPDADDCGGGNCTCMFGPPLPLYAGGFATCVVNQLVDELDGTANAGTGVATTTLTQTSLVHLGTCPLCVGDVDANDGLASGTCQGGPRSGLACDRNASSPDFGQLSYDCPPDPMANISGPGVKVRYALTSVEAPPIGTDLLDGTTPVFCMQCSLDPSVACSADADCAASGLGTCTATTGPQARANDCDDGICTAADPSMRGTCAGNADELYCDGWLRGDDTGVLPCTTNTDCSSVDPFCPNGDCGTCTHAQKRSCFPDPFAGMGSLAKPGATVSGGVYGVDLVTTFCAPATGSAVDEVVGLPGPGRLTMSFGFATRCESDNDVPFELPGGSNCP